MHAVTRGGVLCADPRVWAGQRTYGGVTNGVENSSLPPGRFP
jgi:hypothetical protein